MPEPPSDATAARAPRREPGPIATALALVVLVLASCAVRIAVALRDPGFDAESSEGLLKSDPALLYYFAERIVEAGGLAPDDFRAEPRVAWPELVDVPAVFTVGQEFLVAWCQLASGGALPLHVTALVAMALCASLGALGAYMLARELATSRRAGLFAAVLWCALPANYRTIGFVLVREDLSFPLFALHLGLLARAQRVESVASWLVSGVALAAALATWHALSFFVALEAAAFALVFLASGRSPFGARGALVLALPVLAACAFVPVLRTTSAWISPAVIAGAALVAAACVGRRRGRAGALLAFAAMIVVGLALRRLLAEHLADYAHVHDVLWAKLRHLGRLPADPNELSFDARLMWQGPFETLSFGVALGALGVASIALFTARSLRREREREPAGATWDRADSRTALVVLALLALPAAWLVSRTIILAGLLLPALLAVALARWTHAAHARRCALAALAVQALFFAQHALAYTIPWYGVPGRREELALLVRALPGLVPIDEAVAADFMSSTAVLAQTRRPILYQPKYETDASRRRIEEFLSTFYFEPPEALRALLVERYRCRHLLVDRSALGYGMRYLAGLRPGEEPPPGSSAALFLSQDAATLAGVPRFELLYRSPPTILQSNGQPYDLFRLYRMTAE